MQTDRKIEDQKSNGHVASVIIFKTNKKKVLSAIYSFFFLISSFLLMIYLFEDFALVELFTVMFTFPKKILINQLFSTFIIR